MVQVPSSVELSLKLSPVFKIFLCNTTIQHLRPNRMELFISDASALHSVNKILLKFTPTMKTALILLASLLPFTATAFAPAQISLASSHATKSTNVAILASASHANQIPSLTRRHATMTAEELADLSEEEMHEILGVEKEKLALGIDADEVLEFIGTWVLFLENSHLALIFFWA